MSETPTRRELIAYAARELALTGQCRDTIEIEVDLILRDFGEAPEILRDPMLRAELELLCEEAAQKRGA